MLMVSKGSKYYMYYLSITFSDLMLRHMYLNTSQKGFKSFSRGIFHNLFRYVFRACTQKRIIPANIFF